MKFFKLKFNEDLDVDLELPESSKRLFWLWFNHYKNTEIVAVKLWFIKFKIKVKDLRPIFNLLFGG